MNTVNRIDVKKIIYTVILGMAGLMFMMPFIWMLSASFKPEGDVFNYPIEWIPRHWNAIENYREVWFGKANFLRYYWNSIKISGLTTLFSCIVSSLAAFGFSKIDFRGRNTVFFMVLALYMIPHEATLVPLFILYRELNLYDTHIGLILMGSFSVLGTFMLRQFFMGVHNEYIESAQLDGAGFFKIFMRIALPLCKPAVITYAILRFIWTWNDYQGPLIFLRSSSQYTVQLGISQFADAHGEFYSLIMAGSVSAILPLLIVFILGQKQIIEGISLGGVKG